MSLNGIQIDEKTTVWVQLIHTQLYGEQPAFAPNCDAATFVEAYDPFLYADEDSVKREIADVWETAKFEYWDSRDPENADPDEDEYYSADEPDDDGADFGMACTITEDGTIVTEYSEIPAEKIFRAFGLDMPPQLAALSNPLKL